MPYILLIALLTIFGCESTPDVQSEPETGAGLADASSQHASDPVDAPPSSEAGPAPDLSPADAGARLDASVKDPDITPPRADAGSSGGAGEYKSITVDTRMVTVYLPPEQEGLAPPGVVFSLHGLSIPAILMADVTGLPVLADKENFVAVFPEGSGGSWNTEGSLCGIGVAVGNANDDVGYLKRILAEVQKLRPYDAQRVYVSGFSMGGYATNALACKHPELFRAAAAAAGGFSPGLCGDKRIPIMILHGTSDGTISYDCGVQARASWAAHNGCSNEVDVHMVTGGKCEWSRNCPAHAQVVFCSFDGMGHGWAGSYNPFAFGGGPLYESATTLMWDFFKAQ